MLLLTGLFLVVVAGVLYALDFLGVTPGAAGVVNLIVLGSVGILLGGVVQATIRRRHETHRHALH